MFGFLFGGAMAVPGGGDGYREFMLPGMFAMTMAFGLEATMIAVSYGRGEGRDRPVPLDADGAVGRRGRPGRRRHDQLGRSGWS